MTFMAIHLEIACMASAVTVHGVPVMRGVRNGLAAVSSLLIQPLLQDSQTTLTFLVQACPGFSRFLEEITVPLFTAVMVCSTCWLTG